MNWNQAGKFFHIFGGSDKGRAVSLLRSFYHRAWPSLRTIGVGETLSDLPLLKSVDIPVLLQRDDGGYADGPSVEGMILADGPGPEGWNRAILELFER